MKTILVTGSKGLLGSALIKNLSQDSNYNVIGHSRENCDLNNTNDTVSYIQQQRNNGVDTIIHCAAEVGGVLKNTLYSKTMFYNNLKINNNIIMAAQEAEIENFVNLLSTCLFPDKAIYPLTPDQIYNGDPHSSSFGYALAKRLSFQTIQSYHKVFNLNWLNIIPTNIYGMHDNFHLQNSHVIAALIQKAHKVKSEGGDFTIWGSGEIYRQFIYSDDLAKLVIWALENWTKTEGHNDPFMAVNPTEYTIKELALIIAKKFDIDENKINFDISKPEGIKRMTASSNANWFKFTPLEKGLDETIKWYNENFNNIRK